MLRILIQKYRAVISFFMIYIIFKTKMSFYFAIHKFSCVNAE